MRIKKLFGMCERKGCKKLACRCITIAKKNTTGCLVIYLCEDCTWDLYEHGAQIIKENKK